MKLKNMFLIIFFMILPISLPAKDITFSRLTGMQVANICSQVLVEAYQRMGITVHIKQVPAKRSLIVSNSGKVDGEVVRIKGVEKNYPNLVRVKSQICSTKSRVYIKSRKFNFKFNGWESLRPYKIGIIRGHLYAENGTQGMNVVSVKSNELLFKMLDRERVDVAIAQVPDALYAISEFKLQGIEGLDPPIVSMPLYHYLHKKNIALLPEIEEIINEMTNEGRLTEIEDAFISKLKKHISVNTEDAYEDLY